MFSKFIVFPINSVFTALRNKVYLACFDGQLTEVSSSGVRAVLVKKPKITLVTPVTTDVITSATDVDEVHYITPAGTIAAMTFVLPAAANARVGQIKRICSSQIVSTFTLTLTGSGTLVGATLSALAANVPYAWQCISVNGVGTWMRIQ